MPELSRETKALLDDLERRIEPEVEEDFIAQWSDFTFDRFEGELFAPKRKRFTEPGVPLRHIRINEAIENYDAMLYSQMAKVSSFLSLKAAEARRSANLSIRANYGTGILSSLFGAELFMMADEADTLPTTKQLPGDDAMERILGEGMPDFRKGLGEKVFAFAEFASESLKDYPKISKYVTVYHPDLQGPLDICDLLFGEKMFYAFYDDPELLHGVLDLITETYTGFLKAWHEFYPPRPDMNPHWDQLWHRGTILLRNDSAMNLSPDIYEEFSVPYDAKLLARFGGGAMHFCGRGDHYIEALCRIPGLYAVNMSQPHLNDMEKIYRNTVDKGIKLVGFDAAWAEKDLARGFRHNLSI